MLCRIRLKTMARSSSKVLTRRRFIAAMSAPLIAAGCERLPYDSRRFTLPPRSAVGLFPAAHYAIDFADLIFRGFTEMGVDVRGRRVLLKPNMVEYEPGTAINTHPLVVAGAAAACQRAGAAEV